MRAVGRMRRQNAKLHISTPQCMVFFSQIRDHGIAYYDSDLLRHAGSQDYPILCGGLHFLLHYVIIHQSDRQTDRQTDIMLVAFAQPC